jgi:hypothetical protein
MGLFPVADAEDFDPIAVIVESNAIVAETETQFRRLDILQALHIAFAGRKETGNP